MKPTTKKILVLIVFLTIIIYYFIVNVIYFAPLPYSVTEGTFSLTSTEYQVIHEQWMRLATLEIELTSGGPLLVIHKIISDDYTEEITQGKYQDRFQTWQISLSTWGTNATSATGTYKIIDYTSPLLPKPKHNYVASIEIYVLFMMNATILLIGLLSVILIVTALLIRLQKSII